MVYKRSHIEHHRKLIKRLLGLQRQCERRQKEQQQQQQQGQQQRQRRQKQQILAAKNNKDVNVDVNAAEERRRR